MSAISSLPSKSGQAFCDQPVRITNNSLLSHTASVFGEAVVCPGFRHRATGTTDVRGFLEHANVQQAVLTPWMMEDVARQPDAEHYIRKLEVVLFGGGQY